jgi:type I restriction enzyme S subunit
MAKKKACAAKISVLPKEKQPFKIPNNWFWTDIASINGYSGTAVDPMKFPETIYELYSVPSSANDFPEIISGSEIGSSKQSVIKNDVLLCKINPRINRVWKVSQHTENELLASSEWIVIRNQILNSDYMMFCFRTQFFREYMLSNVSGVGGSLMRAQPKFVKNYPIPIAPVAEQQRIVDRIESIFAKLDEAKEKAQAVVDGFELRKSAILHKAFTGELTEKWREEHGVTLDSWEKETSTQLFSYVTSGSRGWAQYYSDSGSVFIRMGNLDHGTVELDMEDIQYVNLPSKAEGQRSKLQKNDILISITADIGMIGLVKNADQDMYINQHIALARPTEENNSEFIAWYLVSDVGLKQMQSKQRGATKIGLGLDDIRNLKLLMPQVNEQVEIVRVLDSLLAKENAAKEAAESVLDQIDTMKKAVLARAFRGELGTNDPTEESAVELLKKML